MEKLEEKIIGITMGIRSNRSFRIPEISGEIIDDVLYGSDTPFGTSIFPRIQETRREKVLFNDQTTGYLRINTDDIILALEVQNNFDTRFSFLTDTVLPYFKDDIFKKYGIKNIRRIGVIFAHKIESGKKLNEAVKTLTQNKIDSVDNIGLSFSKKLAATEALYRKGVNDYKNTIYNMTEKESAVLAELDYQYYYNPSVEDLRDCSAEKVLVDAKSFLQNDYYQWLQEYKEGTNYAKGK